MENIIKDTYYNPEEGLISARKLYEKLKTNGVKYKDIKDFFRKTRCCTTSQTFKA